MTQMSSSSPQQDFSELFEFLGSEREDVRKGATSGLASLSKDCPELTSFLSSHPDSIATLHKLLTVQFQSTLGDVLTSLINIASDANCTEVLVNGKIVLRTMRLVESLEVSEMAATLKSTFREMSMMLLNNLTACHIGAVNDLIQAHDEDMRGYFISKLYTSLCRLPDPSTPDVRDTRKWYFQVILNSTRVPEGQLVLSEDEDWVNLLKETLLEDEPNEILQCLAAQILKNCSATKKVHKNLLTHKVPQSVLKVVRTPENRVPKENWLHLVEFLAQMLQSEEGMQSMEEVNAKNLLLETMELENEAGSPRVPEEAKKFLEEHVLPFLDDIKDAYVMGDGAEDVD